jgi:formate dehydrogenase subunit gamma
MSEEHEQFERFSVMMRLQHLVLAASCIILIVTGLPLRYADSVVSAYYFGLLHGVHVSGIIHRIGAGMLIAVGVFHLFWIVCTREGRANFRALLPRFQDVKDVVNNVLWYFGLVKQRARFHRFSYVEKFDYWAVYWGCVIMIGSGLMLWLNDLTMRYLPKVAIDIAHEAHSDEALLATLAILIWHFYNVHLNPDRFPMSWTWITGKISRKEMVEHHPREYEELVGHESAAEKAADGEE